MADNYLEKRYDEVFGHKTTVKKIGRTLDSLLIQNRSTRGYKADFEVKDVTHNYYRTPDNTHVVPKVRIEDLLI